MPIMARVSGSGIGEAVFAEGAFTSETTVSSSDHSLTLSDGAGLLVRFFDSPLDLSQPVLKPDARRAAGAVAAQVTP
jgi:hypothetical protein